MAAKMARMARAKVELVEQLEGCVLLDAHSAAIWHINGDRDGQATDDTIVVQVSPQNPTQIEAIINGQVFGTRPRARLGHVLIRGRGGNDRIEVELGPDDADLAVTMLGGAGNDTLLGGAERDDIRGGVGDDRLNGGGGRNRLCGGDGVNKVSGGGDQSADVIYGSVNDDVHLGARDELKLDSTDRSRAVRLMGPRPVVEPPAGPVFVPPNQGDVLPILDWPPGESRTGAPPAAPIAPIRQGSSDAGYVSAADSINRFGLDLYSRLSESEAGKNLFFSPYSISSALAMTYLAAHGQTAEEMAQTLYYPQDAAALGGDMGRLNGDVNGDGSSRQYELDAANALWGQKGFGFQQDYLDALQADFGAGLNQVDFKNDTETAQDDQ